MMDDKHGTEMHWTVFKMALARLNAIALATLHALGENRFKSV